MRDTSRGFTVIEVTVTLLVLGILALLTVGTFKAIGARTGNANADQSIRRVVVNEQAIAKDWERYTPFAADLTSVGADITIVAGSTASTGPNSVSIAVGDQGSLGLAALTGQGTCTRYNLPAQTSLDPDAVKQTSNTATANCTGASALPSGENAATISGTTVKS